MLIFVAVCIGLIWDGPVRTACQNHHGMEKVVNPFLPVHGLASGEFFGSVNPELRDCSLELFCISLLTLYCLKKLWSCRITSRIKTNAVAIDFLSCAHDAAALVFVCLLSRLLEIFTILCWAPFRIKLWCEMRRGSRRRRVARIPLFGCTDWYFDIHQHMEQQETISFSVLISNHARWWKFVSSDSTFRTAAPN